MKPMRRFFLGMLILSQLFCMNGLAGGAETGEPGSSHQPVDGDWLIYHLNAEPGTLNPITATDAYESTVNGFIYESLLKRDPKTMEMVPELAESWEVAEDHLSYTFRLKKDIRWQDGTPLTARDIQFSFDIIRSPHVDAAHLRNYYRDVETLEVLDDYTVRFRYRVPYFLALNVVGGMPLLPSHLFREGDDFNKHPIGRNPMGTGPYRFVKWDTGKEIVLVRNENYWGPRPHLSRIVFKIITEQTVSLQVLKQGGLDLMSLRPIQWMRQTQSERFQEHFRKIKYYMPSYSYIGWNMRKPIFQDVRVRRAMTMLTDRETILNKVLFGLGTVVSGPFYVKSPEYNEDVKPLPFDPKAAVALLREAGWEDHDGDGILDKDGKPFAFEFLISSGSKFAEQLGTMLQENLKGVGVRMEIRKLEWAVFIQRIDERNFDAVTLAWNLSWESDPFQLWHSSMAEKGSNFTGFKNEEADGIIEASRKEFDALKRRQMMHRFHEIVHDEQPYTFLFTTEALSAVARRFENVNAYPAGMRPMEWWVPKEQQKYGDF